ncbi:hypothetical protein [Pseudonocardia acaciae]|uniref:hypothetical protein n=1 Tax=Pseudonocardia acaciae TaxID=551276 RepID=UPI0004910158|nr:hypothetical protein [Pseudonocardia acaciae]
MADQRLAGLSHQELWNLAHGGDPAAASRSQAAFSRVAQVLGGVSRTINAPLAEFGIGWRGMAADAGRAGIAQHAQWAEAAATRATLAGNQAGQQAASARTVIAEMPPPAPAPPAGAAAPTTGPAAANWAQAEQAAANARQRALELMQGHAAECARTRPTGGFAPAPTAGAGGGAARAVAGGADGRGGAAGRVRGLGGGMSGMSGMGGVSGASGAGGAGGGRGGVVGRPVSVAAAGASVTPHPGARPGSVAAVSPVQHGATALGAVFGAPVRPGRMVGPRAEASRPGDGGTGPATAGRRGTDRTRAEPLPERPVPVGGASASPVPDQRDGLPAAPGPQQPHGPPDGGTGTDPGARGQGRPGAVGPPAPMVPPLLGGAGMVGDDATYERPDFLLDDSDLFTDDGWVAPPVIGQ